MPTTTSDSFIANESGVSPRQRGDESVAVVFSAHTELYVRAEP